MKEHGAMYAKDWKLVLRIVVAIFEYLLGD